MSFKSADDNETLGIVTVDTTCPIVNAVRQIETERSYGHTILEFHIGERGSVSKDTVDAFATDPVSSLLKKIRTRKHLWVNCYFKSSQSYKYQLEVNIRIKNRHKSHTTKPKKFKQLFIRLNDRLYGRDIENYLYVRFGYGTHTMKIAKRLILPNDMVVRSSIRKSSCIDIDASDTVSVGILF